MIFLRDKLNFSAEESTNIYLDYLKFVGNEHIKTMSARGWDYAAIIKNADFKSSDIVLDIGCAASYFILYIDQFVGKAYGIDDIDNGGFARFTKPWLETLVDFDNYKNGKVEIINQNAVVLPFPDNYFDKVFTTSVLEHFKGEDDRLCVKEIVRVLKVGGSFLGTVDYNPITEYPVKGSMARTYTYESFLRRILQPSGLTLKGKDFLKDIPIPLTYNEIAEALFFHLEKK